MVSEIMALQNTRALIPTTCEYVRWHSKRHSVDGFKINLRFSRWAKCNYKSLRVREESKRDMIMEGGAERCKAWGLNPSLMDLKMKEGDAAKTCGQPGSQEWGSEKEKRKKRRRDPSPIGIEFCQRPELARRRILPWNLPEETLLTPWF